MHKLWPHSVKKSSTVNNKSQANAAKVIEEKKSPAAEGDERMKTESTTGEVSGSVGDEANQQHPQTNGTTETNKNSLSEMSNKTSMCLINELIKLNRVKIIRNSNRN